MTKPEGSGHRERGLARLSSGVLLTNVLAAVALLATTVLTARAFGPGGRGELSLATQFVTLVATLGSLGLTAAAAYHSARAKWSKPVAFGSSTLLGLLLGLVILAGCYLVILVGDVTFKGLPKTDLALAALALPFFLAVLATQSVYQGFRDFRDFNRITLAQAALPLLLIGIAIGLGGGVRAAIIATVAAVALLFVAVLVNVQRRLESSGGRSLRIFARLSPSACAYTRRTCSATSATGSTSSSSTATRAQPQSASMVPASSSPRASGCRRRRQHRALPDHRRREERAGATVDNPLCRAEHALADGDSRRDSRPRSWPRRRPPLLQSLQCFRRRCADPRPRIVLFSAARVLNNDIAARGRPLVNSAIAAASVVCNIALNVVLIPRYGINGAAWASTASYSLLFLATAGVYRRITRVPLRALLVPTRDDGPRYVRLIKRVAARPRQSSCRAQPGIGLE